MTEKRVVFHLKRFWDYGDGVLVNLYQDIKEGRKTIEFRNHKQSPTGKYYWASVLLTDQVAAFVKIDSSPDNIVDITEFSANQRAIFIVGFPKNNLPRLETAVPKLEFNKATKQYYIHIANVQEITNEV